MKNICLILVLPALALQGQNTRPDSQIPLREQPAATVCIDENTYREIQEDIDRNGKLYGPDSMTAAAAATVLLDWPLRASSRLKDCHYYTISAYVDQNTATGVTGDWNCGSRTYDGHRGVDIVPWPFIWHKMDSNLVEVIAAAGGTIISKADGNPDRVCNGVGGGSSSNNYIVIQHADGSTALYAHLKTGAFTSKGVGQTVVAGELLGIVGSAGQSTGVHLHFEIRSDGNFANYLDPFHGTCNSKTTSSWWASQKPYEEPAILKMSIHEQWPYMGVCPNTTDTLYEKDNFPASAGNKAVFYVCSRDVSTGMTWNFRIKNNSGTVSDSWSYSSLSNRKISTLGWTRSIPPASGSYTFEGSFNGNTCSKTFTVGAPTSAAALRSAGVSILFTPNPSPDGSISLSRENQNASAEEISIRLYTADGRCAGIYLLAADSPGMMLSGLPPGLYTYVYGGSGCAGHGRFVVQ